MKWILNLINKNPKLRNKIIIFLLRKAALESETKVDDELVDLIEQNL